MKIFLGKGEEFEANDISLGKIPLNEQSLGKVDLTEYVEPIDGMVLNIISPPNGFVDFSYILGDDTNLEYTENATLDWGDGSDIVNIIGNEYTTDKAKLQHTYSKKNKEYKITIKGKIKWYGTESSTYIPDNTRNAIISIELPNNNSPIQFITAYGFYNFTRLQSIPSGLFDNCTEVTDFSSCFDNCTSLRSIPENLFKYNINVNAFNWCFAYCNGVSGKLPELWKTHPMADGYECFNSCWSASNYSEALASGWAWEFSYGFSIETLNDNTLVDLSQHLTPLEDDDEINIHWGDDAIEVISINNAQHIYKDKGEYIIDIEGNIEYTTPKTRAIQTDFIIKDIKKNEHNN